MNPRTFLALALAGGATLAAQSLKPGLDLIPATVQTVEFYTRPAELEANGKALSGLAGQDGAFTPLASRVGLEPSELDSGPAFLAEYAAPKAAKGKASPAEAGKAAPAMAPAPFLAVVPAAQGDALLVRLHA